MSGLLDDLMWRGLVHQTTDPALGSLLARDQVTLYAGFDPTADSLHVGSLQPILNLVRFQRAGHRPIALAGGGTGLIGDPSGKSEERILLTPDVLEQYVFGIRAQLERFLDFSPTAGSSQAVLVDNSAWLNSLHLIEFLRDVGKHFTINAMIAKESVRARLEEREHGISYTEFSYMLLQAFDFLHLFDTHRCTLQLGGSDQWGNITLGIDLIRRRRGAAAYGLTSPLVLKSDGTKFGKTESGTVWLDPKRTSPYAFYQFFIRTEDAVAGSYLRRFTFLEREEIMALEHATETTPERREAQRALAREVTTLVHGADEAVRAEGAAAVLFSEEVAGLDEPTLLAVFAEAPATPVARSELDGGLDVVDVLVRSGLEKSRSSARRAIEQGGAYVNNRKVDGIDRKIVVADLLHDRYVILRRGRKDHHLLRFG